MKLFYKQVGPRIISISAKTPILIPYLGSSQSDELFKIFPDGWQIPDCTRSWFIREPWEFTLYTDCGVMRGKAKEGWAMDLASIPGVLEMIEKRDDRKGLIPATIHDMMYALQYPTFEVANCLFRQGNHYYGMSKAQTWRRWWSVENFGYGAWKNSSPPWKVDSEKLYISITESDK